MASRVRLVIALLGLGMIAVPGAVSAAHGPPGDAATEAVASAQAPNSDNDDDTAINAFIQDGLFIGHKKEFLQLLLRLASEADEARREL